MVEDEVEQRGVHGGIVERQAAALRKENDGQVGEPVVDHIGERDAEVRALAERLGDQTVAGAEVEQGGAGNVRSQACGGDLGALADGGEVGFLGDRLEARAQARLDGGQVLTGTRGAHHRAFEVPPADATAHSVEAGGRERPEREPVNPVPERATVGVSVVQDRQDDLSGLDEFGRVGREGGSVHVARLYGALSGATMPASSPGPLVRHPPRAAGSAPPRGSAAGCHGGPASMKG